MISDQEKTTKDPQHDTPANVTVSHKCRRLGLVILIR